MNHPHLIRIGLVERAKRALVFNKVEKAYQLLKWARGYQS